MDSLKDRFWLQSYSTNTSDLPITQSIKFMYADDLFLAIQCEDFETGEIILKNDLKTMNDYYTSWCLVL